MSPICEDILTLFKEYGIIFKDYFIFVLQFRYITDHLISCLQPLYLDYLEYHQTIECDQYQ